MLQLRGEAPLRVPSLRRVDAMTASPVRLSLVERAKRAVRRFVVGAESAPATQNTFPATPFGAWTYDDAIEAIDDAMEDSELDAARSMRDAMSAPIPGQAVFYDPRLNVNQLTINRAFFEGDHWQMGNGWIGPHPNVGEKDFEAAMVELVGAFTSKNVVREVTKRHASGVIGKEPSWSFVPRRVLKEGEEPTADEQTAIDTANALVREWYDARKVRSLVHDAVCTLLFAARSPLRLYVPAGLLDQQVSDEGGTETILRASSVQHALGMIWPDHPAPEHAAVVTDDDTKMEAGVRRYSTTLDDDDDEDDASTPGAAGNDEQEMVEVVYLDQSGQTVMRVLSDDDSRKNATAAKVDPSALGDVYDFNFGARLTMIEMRRDPLITPQVCQQQRALNLAISMLPRNVITGGFLERVLLNAQMPGKFVTDIEGAPKRFVPDALQFGPGTTNMFAGIEVKDAMGNKTLATPSVSYRDPVPVDAPVKAAQEHYLAILDETNQLHTVLSGDAVVSGKSREQARAEFENSLSDTRPEVEAALRFLLETPLAMAEALSGHTGELTSLVRIEVQCRIDTGPLDAAERTALEASIGKTLSRETAMARVNVDDVDAELARMASDPLSRAVLVKAQGDALTSATTSGITVETAAEWVGIDPAIVTKIKKDVASSGFSDNAPLANNPAGGNGTTPPADNAPAPSTSSSNAPAKKAGRTPPAAGSDHTQATGGAASRAGGS